MSLERFPVLHVVDKPYILGIIILVDRNCSNCCWVDYTHSLQRSHDFGWRRLHIWCNLTFLLLSLQILISHWKWFPFLLRNRHPPWSIFHRKAKPGPGSNCQTFTCLGTMHGMPPIPLSPTLLSDRFNHLKFFLTYCSSISYCRRACSPTILSTQ